MTQKNETKFTIHSRLNILLRIIHSTCSITAALTPIFEKPPSWNKF